MRTIIFKNEKKARIYDVFAAKSFHVFSKGELLHVVKTDIIEKLFENYKSDEISIIERNKSAMQAQVFVG